MDNLTHTLTGMMVAEGVCAARREGRSAFRTAAYASSAIANNIPDIDPIYMWITKPRPLGSLLHHRGHTHTLPIAWLMGWLVALGVLAWLERKRGRLARRDRRVILGLGLFGATLHIAMDFANNYGVHPFWPLNTHWFYGDSIFIVEPLWLAIALPTSACAIHARGLAWFLWLLLAALFALAFALPFIRSGTVAAMAVASVICIAASRLGSARTRSAVAWAGVLGVAACFIATQLSARTLLRAALARDYPTLRVADIATSPMPGNPLCWNALAIGQQGSHYRVLSAHVAPLPSLSNAASCPYDASADITAHVTPLAQGSGDALRWHWSYRSELATLRGLARRDCRFRALLRFTRAPYVSEVVLPQRRAQPQRVAGDLRYDRRPGLDFADMRLDDQHVCPQWVPPWRPPREAMLLRP